MWKHVFFGYIKLERLFSNNRRILNVTLIFVSLNSCKENTFLPRNPFPFYDCRFLQQQIAYGPIC